MCLSCAVGIRGFVSAAVRNAPGRRRSADSAAGVELAGRPLGASAVEEEEEAMQQQVDRPLDMDAFRRAAGQLLCRPGRGSKRMGDASCCHASVQTVPCASVPRLKPTREAMYQQLLNKSLRPGFEWEQTCCCGAEFKPHMNHCEECGMWRKQLPREGAVSHHWNKARTIMEATNMLRRRSLDSIAEENARRATAIWAHRGLATGRNGENTLEAFREALALGADGICAEVRCTYDGHAVVLADSDLSLQTNAIGQVGDISLKALRQLERQRARGVFPSRIPTLHELLDLVLRPGRWRAPLRRVMLQLCPAPEGTAIKKYLKGRAAHGERSPEACERSPGACERSERSPRQREECEQVLLSECEQFLLSAVARSLERHFDHVADGRVLVSSNQKRMLLALRKMLPHLQVVHIPDGWGDAEEQGSRWLPPWLSSTRLGLPARLSVHGVCWDIAALTEERVTELRKCHEMIFALGAESEEHFEASRDLMGLVDGVVTRRPDVAMTSLSYQACDGGVKDDVDKQADAAAFPTSGLLSCNAASLALGASCYRRDNNEFGTPRSSAFMVLPLAQFGVY